VLLGLIIIIASRKFSLMRNQSGLTSSLKGDSNTNRWPSKLKSLSNRLELWRSASIWSFDKNSGITR
jgi:hypothetical protein